MKTVLIIGPNFFDYNTNIANAFTTLGYHAIIESFDNPIHPFKGQGKWLYKFSFRRSKLREKYRIKYNQYILEKFAAIQPNFVFILNGNILITNTLDHFRKSAKVFLWMYDSLQRYPLSIGHIDHVDAFFCYEKQDVEWYAQQNKKSFFMPQAYDEKQYYPLNTKKDIDILFVGRLYQYSKRIRLLRSVVHHFYNKKICIYGVYKPPYKNIFKWLFREKRTVYKNKNLMPQEVNKYYNRAKIVLNIHHETQKYGANPKVFEISGAGAYQICDTNPFIKTLFPNGEVGFFCTEQELLSQIEHALQSDVTDKATQAQNTVISKHTFSHRIKEMLDIELQMNSNSSKINLSSL